MVESGGVPKKKRQFFAGSIQAATSDHDWVNTGSASQNIGGGGYHQAYAPGEWEHNAISIAGAFGLPDTPSNLKQYPPIPGVGAQLYQAEPGFMYGYKEDGTLVIIGSDKKDARENTDEMSEQMKEVKNAGSGPVLIHDVSKPPGQGHTIALVSALGGGKWVPRQCNNLEQYVALFGGENRLGIDNNAWSGGDDPEGYVKSNMSADPFANGGAPPQSIEDTEAGIVVNPSLWINVLLTGAEKLMETVAVGLTAGLAEPILALAQPAIDAGLSALADEGGKAMSKITGFDDMKKGWEETGDIFADSPKPVGTVNTPDNTFLKDERIEVAVDKYSKEKQKFEEKKKELAEENPELSESKRNAEMARNKTILGRLDKGNSLVEPVEHFATQHRDRSKDYQHFAELEKKVGRLEFMTKNVENAQTALEHIDNIKKMNWDLGEHQRGQNADDVLEYLIPREDLDLKKGQALIDEFTQNMQTNFQFDFGHDEELAKGAYMKMKDQVAGLTGVQVQHLHDILTDDDRVRFEQLVDDSKAHADDWYEYNRQKMRAFQAQR